MHFLDGKVCKGENIFIAFKTVPRCIYVRIFVKTGTFEVVVFITRFTFDFKTTLSYNVTFFALVMATFVAKPAKRFFFSIQFKLRSS